MCEKHTEVMKEQHVSVHAFPCSELELHTSLCEMRPPPPAGKHPSKTGCYCLGEARVLQQSLQKLEMK